MPAVSLKDLMNPLTKIASLNEQNSEKLDQIIEIMVDPNLGLLTIQQQILDEIKTQTALLKDSMGNTIGNTLQEAILAELKVQSQLLRNQSGDKVGLSSIFGKGGNKKDDKSLSENASALKLLGAGTITMAKALILFRFVPKKAVTKFTSFITGLFEKLSKFDTKKVKEGSIVLDMMGGAIMKFTKSLALSALLLIPGIIAIPFLILSIGLVGRAVALIGELGKPIKEGSKAMERIGKGVMMFAAGLAIFGLTAMFLINNPAAIVVMALTIVAIGGAIALIGKLGKPVKKGSEAMEIMGKGVMMFAAGLAIFGLTAMFLINNPIAIVLMPLTIVAIGGAIALIGNLSKPIKKGSKVMVKMGIGLAAFSLGYGIFRLATMKTDLTEVGMQALILGGIGLIAGLLGWKAEFVGLGAIAFIAIGAGLAAFGLGYSLFRRATEGLGVEEATTQALALGSIAAVMALAGAAVFFTGGAALLGPILFAAAGASLLLLAPGLKAFNDLNFGEPEADKLAYTLGAVAAAFSGADTKDGPLGFVGGLFTRVVQSGGMLTAAAGYMAAGEALISLSKGLTKFQELGWNDEKTTILKNMLTGISLAFASAAGDDEPIDGGGFFGTVFGIKRTRVEEGIRSVMDAGDALTNIAKGLQSFQNLINSKIKFGDPKDPDNDYGGKDTLAYAVINTVGFIQEAFAAVADEGNVDAGGFFGTLFGIKKNKVKQGIDSVRGAGTELKNIAMGLKEFQKMVEKEIDFSKDGKLATAVKNSLTFVGNAFASIAGGEFVEGDSWGIFNWDENKVNDGITAVGGAGTELKNIVMGLKEFQTMTEREIDFSKDGKLATAVKNSLLFVGNAFASIGGKEFEEGDSWGIFNWDESTINKGITAVSGAGESLKNIAEGLMTFSKMEDPTKISNSIKILLESMSGTFSSFYDNDELFSTKVNNFSGFIQTLADVGADGSLMKAADGFEKIAKAINSVDPEKASLFRDLFDATVEMGKNERNEAAFEAMIEAIEELRDVLSNNETGIGAQISGAFQNIQGASGVGSFQPQQSPQGESSPNLGYTLNKIESTLSRMDTTLASLPSDIAAIEIKISDDL